MRGAAQWQALDDEIAWFDRQIAEHASHDPLAQRCMNVCGVGRPTASAAAATVVDARQPADDRLAGHRAQTEEQRRQTAARAHHQTEQRPPANPAVSGSTIGHILTAHRRDDRLSRWIVQFQARVGCYKTLVAVANACAYPVGRAGQGRTVRSVLRTRPHQDGGERVKPKTEDTMSPSIDFVVEDSAGKDSGRSDRQRANSNTRQALYRMYSSSRGWSPAARLLSGPGHRNHLPNKAVYKCALSRRRLCPCGLDWQCRSQTNEPLNPACKNGAVFISKCKAVTSGALRAIRSACSFATRVMVQARSLATSWMCRRTGFVISTNARRLGPGATTARFQPARYRRRPVLTHSIY